MKKNHFFRKYTGLELIPPKKLILMAIASLGSPSSSRTVGWAMNAS